MLANHGTPNHPAHGNGVGTGSGWKTRSCIDIVTPVDKKPKQMYSPAQFDDLTDCSVRGRQPSIPSSARWNLLCLLSSRTNSNIQNTGMVSTLHTTMITSSPASREGFIQSAFVPSIGSSSGRCGFAHYLTLVRCHWPRSKSWAHPAPSAPVGRSRPLSTPQAATAELLP